MGFVKRVLGLSINSRTPKDKVTELWENYVSICPFTPEGDELPFGWKVAEELAYKAGDEDSKGLTPEDIKIIEQMSEEAFSDYLAEKLWQEEKFSKDD